MDTTVLILAVVIAALLFIIIILMVVLSKRQNTKQQRNMPPLQQSGKYSVRETGDETDSPMPDEPATVLPKAKPTRAEQAQQTRDEKPRRHEPLPPSTLVPPTVTRGQTSAPVKSPAATSSTENTPAQPNKSNEVIPNRQRFAPAPSASPARGLGPAVKFVGAPVTPSQNKQPSISVYGFSIHESTLVCISGSATGQHATFNNNKITIGRDPKSNLVVNELFVSAHHAEVRFEPAQSVVILEDMGSAHGTWVDGQRVMQINLQEGVQFRIGLSVFALVNPGNLPPVPKDTGAPQEPTRKSLLPLSQLRDYVFEDAEGVEESQITVFAGRDLDNDPVSLKFLSRSMYADGPYFRAKLDQQIAIGRTIQHAHCAKIYAGDTKSTVPYIVEQRLNGGTLTERLDAKEPMTLQEISRVVGQLCDALGYLHKRNIVHQGITPNNIVFDESDNVYLINCGFSRLFNEPKQTAMGVLTGNVRYLATEQLRGDAIGTRCDLYSLGVIIYQMATAHLPFDGATELDIVRQHLETKPPIPRKLASHLPDNISLAILKALDKDPMHRFNDAREMAKSFGYSSQFTGIKEGTAVMFMPTQRYAPYPDQPRDETNPYDYKPLVPKAPVAQPTQLKLKNISSGVIVQIAAPRIVITRDLINPKDNMISRTNGQIYFQNNQWWISELPEANSANGLYVNNIRVKEPKPIRMGDSIRFGKTTMKVMA